MIEQTFVDMTDLFNIEGAEREPPSFGWPTAGYFHLQNLKGIQQM